MKDIKEIVNNMDKAAELKPRAVLPHLKSRAEDNKRLRERRKDAGLVHYRVWVTEAEKRHLERCLAEYRGAKK